MIAITGMDTPTGRAVEMAYRAENRIAPCRHCDAIGRPFTPCLCGSLLLPVGKPAQIPLPTWC